MKTAQERFERFMLYTGDCIVWAGTITKWGYGQFSLGEKMVAAHRMSYQLFVAPLLPGLHVDHLCRNRACVNPTHLEQKTPKENTLAPHSLAITNQHSRKTHCIRGHKFTQENIYHFPSVKHHRRYKECYRLRHRQWSARNRIKLKEALGKHGV